jgi:3'(2'), 5'-bisphosphate nucleotidase
VPIQARPVNWDNPVVMVSRSHRVAQTDAYLSQLKSYREVSRGSSLKLCLIACGDADLYPRHGRTMEWDIAAGHAILSAAGGCIRTLEGEPLRYGKSSLENPHFVASGSIPDD